MGKHSDGGARGDTVGWGQRRYGEELSVYKNTEQDAIKIGLDWWVRVLSSPLGCECSKKRVLGAREKQERKAGGINCHTAKRTWRERWTFIKYN